MAIAPVVNFGTDETLVLTPEVLSGIFLKNITSWLDPLILELNAVMFETLRDAGNITTVSRASGAGSTTIFCLGMSRFVANFAAAVDCGSDTMSFAASGATVGDVLAEHNADALDEVMMRHGSIGYVSYAAITEAATDYARPVTLRHPISKTLTACSSESIEIQLSSHPWLDSPTVLHCL